MSKDFQFLIYRSALEDVVVDAMIQDETIWLTQKAMGELFGVDRTSITRHLKNVFETGELVEDMVCAEIAHTTQHGAIASKTQTRNVKYYNLDAIISVGYRVNSKKATNFRIWATNVITEYITKGFVMDDERLKQGTTAFGKDYFRELLERVRSIRASERRIWQQITDVFAECSIDYDRDSQITKDFYAMIQNKFHYAIVGKTAAEVIYNSADRHKENMGLKTWKNSPDGRILKSDSAVAKNYLNEREIRQLERTISGYFDHIEDLIEQEYTFTMEQFASSVDDFLAGRKRKVLVGKGVISAERAREKAHAEYNEFNKTQKITSDFDREIKRLLDLN